MSLSVFTIVFAIFFVAVTVSSHLHVVCRRFKFLGKYYPNRALTLCPGFESLSRVCITVSNSPKPSLVYIRLCKHGKCFLLLK